MNSPNRVQLPPLTSFDLGDGERYIQTAKAKGRHLLAASLLRLKMAEKGDTDFHLDIAYRYAVAAAACLAINGDVTLADATGGEVLG